MATFLELCDEVRDLASDSSLDSKIKGFVNRAFRAATGDIPVPVPGLFKTGTLTTHLTNPYVTMPTDYQRDLDSYVYSTAQNDVFKLVPTFSELQVMFPGLNETGAILTGCLVGRTLYYQRRPGSADTLRLAYFSYPTALSADSSEPTVLPPHLHERLLVSKALVYCFERIELGLDSKKTNTEYYEGEYQKALADLALWVGPRKRSPVPINDVMGASVGGGRSARDSMFR